MKKNILTLLCLGFIGMFTSCTNNGEKKVSTDISTQHGNTAQLDFDGKKVLVIYFSHAGDNYKVGNVKVGNTKIIADYIAEFTDAKQFEIIPGKNYDVSYAELTKIVRQEGLNREFPPFKGKPENINQYDIIFIGGPIWWGTYPRVMFSFFKEYNLNDKIIIPFTTNEGSGLGNAVRDLKKSYPKAIVLDGFTMLGQEARKESAKPKTEKWLESIGFRSSKSSEILVTVKYSNGKEQARLLATSGAVDLGLSVKWATCNIGASCPWETGQIYAWGETKTKREYTELSYKPEVKDNGKDEDTNISGTKFDVVRKMYGDGWRMPTPQELDELLIKTKAEWVSINDMEGYIFTGKNGKYIFLPATGVAYGNVVDDKNSGYYMSGTSANTINAYVMYLTNETFGVSNYGRFYGLRIRPVKD